MAGTDINFGTKSTATRSRDQFKHFFPAWRDGLQTTLGDYCTDETRDYYNPEFTNTGAAYGVIECLLKHIPTFRQVEMNTSSVILGLTPVLIQEMGVATTQTSMLSLRRPGLAFWLSIGSPGVKPLRSTEYMEMIHKAEDVGGWYPPKKSENERWPTWAECTVTYILYAAALGAVANTYHLAYQLSYWSISTFSVQTTFLPLLWTALALPIHLFGLIAFRLRIKRDTNGEAGAQSLPDSLRRQLRLNLMPSSKPLETKLRLEKDRPLFYILAWVLYIAVQAHYLFGIMLLASMLFISVTDAVGIAARCCASAVVCRLVVMYALMEMQQNGLQLDKSKHGADKQTSQGVQSSRSREHGTDMPGDSTEMGQV